MDNVAVIIRGPQPYFIFPHNLLIVNPDSETIIISDDQPNITFSTLQELLLDIPAPLSFKIGESRIYRQKVLFGTHKERCICSVGVLLVEVYSVIDHAL